MMNNLRKNHYCWVVVTIGLLAYNCHVKHKKGSL